MKRIDAADTTCTIPVCVTTTALSRIERLREGPFGALAPRASVVRALLLRGLDAAEADQNHNASPSAA